ncbi:hypothetical protein BCR37DRAFT_1699 [Protomyces lactucae-debilis]|uniref:Uncharacterized protein n=1 Tax=Protomyces lactucae-debilis TaxID=2754530 RepID=A0A1Y2FUH5_PROLT|nr:uncharacterized protein BCR37DRAFT_1699 [Protomyces lactucae-debilis]ORY87599.1 hypothetical protein BCR37DRAFT_1699 [Protomyces lactucae-debilis]
MTNHCTVEADPPQKATAAQCQSASLRTTTVQRVCSSSKRQGHLHPARISSDCIHLSSTRNKKSSTAHNTRHMDPATATAATAHARRRSSISDYSSLFSNAQPKAASFINKTRHPSLTMSMKGERPPGFSALQRAMGKSGDEQAIVDDESTAAGSSNGSEQGEGTGHRRALTDDPVGLGRRLSQGARAIMYSGNRLKGDGVTLKRTPSSHRPRVRLSMMRSFQS